MNEKERVFKVQIPRTDLRVVAARVKMTPPFGPTAWAAFQEMGDHAIHRPSSSGIPRPAARARS